MSANPADAQKNAWNGPGGNAWVDFQEMLDGMFAPFEKLLVEAVAKHSAKRVLDIGCGTGSTTIAAARKIGAAGRAVGVDISEPMLAVARERATDAGVAASFVWADAQTHEFPQASFDFVISRFGVMFFADPIQAFANLKRAATDDAGLYCIAWRGPEENPFMTAAEHAVGPLLPNLPARVPNAPGQFGFADDGRVRGILEDAGWRGIEVRPLDVECKFPQRELERYTTRMGPVGNMLHEVDATTRGHVIEKLRTAFVEFVHGTEVRYTAACWAISAGSRRR
jgi:SAM-dependent methyltransferase